MRCATHDAQRIVGSAARHTPMRLSMRHDVEGSRPKEVVYLGTGVVCFRCAKYFTLYCYGGATMVMYLLPR